MKPEWHSGKWTDQDTENLREELEEAQTYRSLTPEERVWLETVK